MIKVKLCTGGVMGQIARDVIRTIEGVEIVGEYDNDFDILFSASYPSRIPQEECQKARLGAVNIHTSLLPEGRGSHPLNWALIWGRDKTGITIHKIVDTYDAGDIVVQEEVPIFETDNIVRLRERVETLFPKVIVAFFDDPIVLMARAKKQNQAKATYAQKRRPEDSELNLDADVMDIWNLYRSCDPKEYPAYIISFGKKEVVKSMKVFMDGGYEIDSSPA